jgi:small ligand-binding sensory domain FIST
MPPVTSTKCAAGASAIEPCYSDRDHTTDRAVGVLNPVQETVEPPAPIGCSLRLSVGVAAFGDDEYSHFS